MLRRWSIPLSLAVVLSGSAQASPLLETMGAMGGNAGAQGVVSGPGAASTYFNPALLIDADDAVLLSFAGLSAQMGITLDGRNGADVPLVVAGRDLVGADGKPIPNQVVPTAWLTRGCPAGTKDGECAPPGFAARPRQAQGTSHRLNSYVLLGMVRHIVPDRLTIGMYGVLPLRSFTTARGYYADEREALFSNSLHPELYGDRLTAISLVFGGAFKLLPNLSIGAGVSIQLANTASSATYVSDSANYDSLLVNTSVTTQVSVSPTVGVRWVPARYCRVGAVLHSPSSFVVDTNISGTLPSGTESQTTRRDVFDWMPWSVGFGVEVDLLERAAQKLSVAGSVTYAFWSSYLDRHGMRPSDYGSDLAWADTLQGAIGVRHVYRTVRAFIDAVYVPSPVPAQVGRSNYVDDTRAGFSFGGDVDLHLGGLRLGLQAFVHRLLPRHATKDDARLVDELPDDAVYASSHDAVPGARGLQTNNPGWPGFGSGGFLFGGGLTLQVPL